MPKFLIHPVYNRVDWFIAFFAGWFVSAEYYITALVVVAVGSFISGFLESAYEREVNATKSD